MKLLQTQLKQIIQKQKRHTPCITSQKQPDPIFNKFSEQPPNPQDIFQVMQRQSALLKQQLIFYKQKLEKKQGQYQRQKRRRKQLSLQVETLTTQNGIYCDKIIELQRTIQNINQQLVEIKREDKAQIIIEEKQEQMNGELEENQIIDSEGQIKSGEYQEQSGEEQQEQSNEQQLLISTPEIQQQPQDTILINKQQLLGRKFYKQIYPRLQQNRLQIKQQQNNININNIAIGNTKHYKTINQSKTQSQQQQLLLLPTQQSTSKTSHPKLNNYNRRRYPNTRFKFREYYH